MSNDPSRNLSIYWLYMHVLITYLHFAERRKSDPCYLWQKTKICGCICDFWQLRSIRNITAEIEELTCHKYGNPKNKYNNVLKAEFDKKSKPKPGKNSLDCIESVDPTTLPPYSKVLLQLIQQACYVAAYLYWTAYNAYLAFDLFLIDCSCKLSEVLEMHFFDGVKTPDSIENLEIDGDEEKILMKMMLTILILRIKKVMTGLIMPKFKLV